MPRRRAHPAAAALVLGSLLVAAPAATAGSDPTTGRLLVTLDADRRGPAGIAAAAGRLTSGQGARRAGHSVAALGLLTVRPLAGGSVAALADRLRSQPGVASVEPERRFKLRYVPNDPALTTPETTSGVPPGTTVQWWAVRQGLPGAWDVTRGPSARVAVIDTGIDAGHPVFAGKIEDAVDLDSDPGHGPATQDEVGHGTHVASLACATGDDAIALVGAGFGCKLLVYKTDLSESSVAQAITDATDRGVHAINMSFGTTGDRPVASAIERAIRYAHDNDVVMAAAAADDPVQEQGDPANVLQPTGSGPDITRGLGLSVTAANFNDQRASFAGLGSQISLAAYGAWNTGQGGPRGLLGAFPAQPTELERPTVGGPGCGCRTSFAGDSRYAYVQGTSMAAPIVAATAALVRDLNPDLSADDVIRLLKQTARRAPGATWEPNLGWGILDAGTALTIARTVDRRAPTTRVTAPRRPRSTAFKLGLIVRDTAPKGVTASGVRRVELFRSIDGRRATRIARLTVGPSQRRSFTVKVRRGARYAFYAVGVDIAGNRERAPTRPDARVRLTKL